jgi:citrate lyase subunit beta/citryl-CoA lyase
MSSLVNHGPAWLFCPADRPQRFDKAAVAADLVILDLEDGVSPEHKPAARSAVASSSLDPERTVIRISRETGPDLEVVRKAGYTVVMLPKAETPEQVSALAPLQVIALVETPRGVLEAPGLAAAQNTIGMMWGAEDLVAALGGGSSRLPDGTYRDVARHARSAVLLAAAASGRFALDAVHLDIADLDGLRAEALEAAAVGFAGTACIHPQQVPVVRSAYTPALEDVQWAQRVLAAADSSEHGVFSFEGRMIDAPLLRHAKSILRRA